MSHNQDQIFAVLKQVIRVKKIKYADLALSLNMSLSGVKKIFSEKNCSLEKLLKICESISLPFSQLTELMDSPINIRVLTLSKKADETLSTKPRLYYLLRYIQTSNKTKEQLYSLGFQEIDFDNLKQLLVQEGLIKKSEKIFDLYKTALQTPGESNLYRLIAKKYGAILFNHELNKLSYEDEIRPIFWSQRLSKEDKEASFKEITEVLKKYEKRSSIYSENSHDELVEISYLIVPSNFTPGAEEQGDLDTF